MIIRHFDISTPNTSPPGGQGWELGWHGYWRMTTCWSQQRRSEFGERHCAMDVKGELDESSFEQDCFLSVLADIRRNHVNMFELGAGWGEWCLALAGVINHRLIPLTAASYRCLAVEGEPTHYQWLKEHFEAQNINGVAIHGAVSSTNGKCWFNTSIAPDSSYGQAITSPLPSHILDVRKAVRSLYNMTTKRMVRIPMYTIDYLVQKYGFDHMDLLDIDVQGAEYEVALGATESINNDVIDYLKIGTHGRALNDRLRQLLFPRFDLIIDLYPNSVGIVNGFPPIRCQDGVQLWKRKNL